jgi:DNA-binding NtrC family response regulator
LTNVRELKNVVERAVILLDQDSRIHLASLPPTVAEALPKAISEAAGTANDPDGGENREANIVAKNDSLIRLFRIATYIHCSQHFVFARKRLFFNQKFLPANCMNWRGYCYKLLYLLLYFFEIMELTEELHGY